MAVGTIAAALLGLKDCNAMHNGRQLPPSAC